MKKYILIYYHLFIKKIICAIYDFSIRIKVGHYCILSPLSHNFPLYKYLYPQYGENIKKITEILAKKYSNLTFIDIGANIGDTAALVKSATDIPILCIECDDKYLKYLRYNAKDLKKISIRKAFVGKNNAKVGGRLVRTGGTATISDDLNSFVKSESLLSVLKSSKKYMDSKILKIDTDGYDTLIIKYSIEFISKKHPVIFFEYDPYFFSKFDRDGIKIFNVLEKQGYKKAMFFTNVGDYLISLNLDNEAEISDLHDYFSGRNARLYSDICLFHEDDLDVFEEIRSGERQYFKSFREY